MEELTKQQIVLVTLLVSFVTSIATGIITVALMDQAPPGVTQTINRVVERTIEKVTPAPTTQQASVVTKETIVVKEDDLVVKVVEQNLKSVVSITGTSGSGDMLEKTFLGNGLIVNKEGLIVADVSVVVPILDEAGNPIQRTLKATYSDGTTLILSVVPDVVSGSGIVLLKPVLDDKTEKTVFVPASLAVSTSYRLGQTVIALGGEHVSVATGIISNLADKKVVGEVAPQATSTDAVAEKVVGKITTTDLRSIGKTSGSIIVNLSGDVVGVKTSATGYGDNAYISANLVSEIIPKVSSATTPASKK